MENTEEHLVQCIYTSASSTEFSAEQLTELLTKARTNNQKLNVTGMLLYDRQSFFQILEGTEKAVQRLFRTIAKDDRHCQIAKILFHTIDERVFSQWSMGYAGVTVKDLSSIEGINDFFRTGKCYIDLDSSRAKTLLAAFKEGKWHSKIQ